MIKKKTNILKEILILALIATFTFACIPQEVSAAKSKTAISKTSKKKKSKKSRRSRRSYNPAVTRAQTFDIIRTNSEISALAGLEPTVNDSAMIYSDQDDQIIDDGVNMEELEREDDVTVDMGTFKMLWLSYVDDEGTDDEYTLGGVNKKGLMQTVMNWVGTPYRFGGRSKKAIDCSGFTQTIYSEACEVVLPRTAREQIRVGNVVSRKNLEFGDLIFFHTYSKRFASHVGIYLGDNLFVHAGSRMGVTVSSLESTYYTNRFIGGRRINVKDYARNANKDADDINMQ
jgi:cell wall-associated NlpC family hydrolase